MPSKTIEDFAYQVRNYMRSAEVVEGKNHAYSQENNAVIATIENGKSYKVRWTGSATVTLKKNSASGTEVTSGSTSPLSFTADSDFDLYFGSSADVTEIMVYDGNDTSDTYEPYYVPVKDSKMSWESNGVLGAKNFAKIPISTTTVAGITLDVDSNNTIITATGTCTGDFAKWLVNWDDNFSLPAGDYKLCGCPAQTEATVKYAIGLQVRRNGETVYSQNETGEGISFSVQSGDIIRYGISFTSGYAITGSLIFKPMITLASDVLSDYDHHVPYAMTNRELTEKVTPKTSSITYETGISQYVETNIPLNKVLNMGAIAIDVTGVVGNASTWIIIGTVPIGFKPRQNASLIAGSYAKNDKFDCTISTNGELKIRNNTAAVVAGDIIYINGIYILA